jgi:hypothetical protein
LFERGVVSDFMFAKDAIFALLTRGDEDLALYRQVYRRHAAQAPEPDLVIWLQAEPDTLLARVRHRDRRWSAGSARPILGALADAYHRYFGQPPGAPVLAVNTEAFHPPRSRATSSDCSAASSASRVRSSSSIRPTRPGGSRVPHGPAVGRQPGPCSSVTIAIERRLSAPRWHLEFSCCSASCCRGRAISSRCFDQHAEHIVEGARAFMTLIERYGDAAEREPPGRRGHLGRAQGRQGHAEVNRLLHKTFITPLDREQIHGLINAMDDVLDLLQDTTETDEPL